MPSSGSVPTRRGHIIGAGIDNYLWCRDPWVQVPGSGSLTDIAVLPGGGSRPLDLALAQC